MKKSNFILVGIILTGIFAMSGCQGTQQMKQDKGILLSQDKRTGTIQSLGGALVSSQATHLLRLDLGKTLFLKSKVIDLADPKYADKQVEVAGNIIRTTDGNEVMDVMNIDLLDREVSLVQEAPQWLNYGSDNLHIGLKYRDDFKLQENQDEIILTKINRVTATEGSKIDLEEKKVATITIKVISRDSNFNLLESIGAASDGSTDLLAKGFSKSKITQKALDAYKQAKNDGTQIIYLIKSDYTYQLRFDGGDSATLVTDQNLFYDLLASINFGTNLATNNSKVVLKDTPVNDAKSVEKITKSDTPLSVDNFEKFTSDSMKFSISYPKGYYFGNTVSKSSNILRSYAFSTKPADDKTGELIVLDIVKGNAASGNLVDLGGGKKGIVSKSGNSITVVVEWNKDQYFSINGPLDLQTVVQQMASTIAF